MGLLAVFAEGSNEVHNGQGCPTQGWVRLRFSSFFFRSWNPLLAAYEKRRHVYILESLLVTVDVWQSYAHKAFFFFNMGVFVVWSFSLVYFCFMCCGPLFREENRDCPKGLIENDVFVVIIVVVFCFCVELCCNAIERCTT